MEQRRVAAIAVDAGEWWYLERLLDQGVLPNLAALRRRGRFARLQTDLAYRSELVWARFLSGREPLEDKDWAVSVVFDPATYEVATNAASTAVPFFATDDRPTVVTMDLIHSTVSEAAEGIQVVAWGAHSPQWPRTSKPAGLLQEIDERFGTNPAFGNDLDCSWHNADYLRALGDACELAVHRRVDITAWLLEQQPDWQLLLTCISEFHSVGHHLWYGVDERHPLHGTVPTSPLAAEELARVTRAVDAAIGRLLDLVGEDTTVLVFAMHGFQPADDALSTVVLSELCHRLHFERGLLRTDGDERWKAAGCPPVVPPAHSNGYAWIRHRFADSTGARVRRGVRRLLGDATVDWARRILGMRAPLPQSLPNPTPAPLDSVDDDALGPVRRAPSYQPAYWYRRHWPACRWFVLPSFADGHIRINLRGREAAGTVAPEDYGPTLDEIERVLSSCRDPRTGAPIVERFLRMREDDPFASDGSDADLLVIFAAGTDALEHPELGVIGPVPHLRTAHHSPNGFALLAGPGIEPGDLGERPAADLTPTLLHLLGRQSADVRGTSLLSSDRARIPS